MEKRTKMKLGTDKYTYACPECGADLERYENGAVDDLRDHREYIPHRCIRCKNEYEMIYELIEVVKTN